MTLLNIIGNLFLLSIFLFIVAFYCFSTNKIKSPKLSLLDKLSKRLCSDKQSSEYKKLDKLLERSLSNIGIVGFYKIKLVTLLVSFIFCFLIFVTNTTLQQYQNFNSVVYSQFSQNSIYNSPKVRAENFKIVKSKTSLKNISQNNPQSFLLVKGILLKYSSINNQDLDKISTVTIKDICYIKDLYSLNRLLKYFICFLLSFFVPDWFLKMYSDIKQQKIERELFRLINLLTVIAGSTNITTKNIISILVEDSVYLKNMMQKFENQYLVNRENAYREFLNSPKLRPLSKLISLLRQIEQSDKKIALDNIKNNNDNLDKIQKISYENKIEKKEGLILILFAVGTLILLKIILDFCIGGIASTGNTNF